MDFNGCHQVTLCDTILWESVLTVMDRKHANAMRTLLAERRSPGQTAAHAERSRRARPLGSKTFVETVIKRLSSSLCTSAFTETQIGI